MPAFIETIKAQSSSNVVGEISLEVQASRRRTARFIAFFLLLVVCFAFFAGYLSLEWATQKAIRNEADKERRLVTSTVTVYTDSLSNELERLAVSKRTQETLFSDKEIVFLDHDLAPSADNRGDRDVFVILDSNGKALHTFRRDLPWHEDIYDKQLKNQVSPLLESLAHDIHNMSKQKKIPGPLRQSVPQTLSKRSILELDGGISLATVAAIMPQEKNSAQNIEITGYLLWLRSLDARALNRFEQITGLSEMFVASEQKTGQDDIISVPLVDHDGQVTGYLHWNTSAIAKTIGPSIAPYFIGAAMIILLTTLVLLRQLVRLTDRIVKGEAEATYAALHDALCDLPNRTYFGLNSEAALRRSRLARKDSALLFIDLDHFKQINDSLGHTVGDEVILEVADRLRQVVGNGDLVARVSGDEFLVLLTELEDEAEVREKCRIIEAAIVQPMTLGAHKILTTISMGVSISPEHGIELAELLRRADIALYEAKRNGRGRFEIFKEAMEDSIIIRRELEVEIERALSRGEFQNYYQPIMNRSGEKILAAEALVRWNHPSRGQLAPAAFLAVAEESHLIIKIGEWVLENAIQDAIMLPDITMCVNVSPVQLRQEDFPEVVSRLLERYHLPAERLEMEVTEEVLMNSGDGATDVLARLKAYGVKIALDDFGTGYSSMSYLREYKFNKIKIDRSFTQDLETEGDARSIIKSLIDLSVSIGMEVCVEGIERPTQHDFLKNMDCQLLQGYLFSRPMPLVKFKLWQQEYDVKHTRMEEKIRGRSVSV